MKYIAVTIKVSVSKKEFPLIEINSITEVLDHLDGLSVFVFDLDDTLYSEKMYVRSGYKAIANLLQNVSNAEERLWNFFQQKKTAINELLLEEKIYSKELEKKCVEVYRNNTPTLCLYPHVSETLSVIREKKKLLGLITDGRPAGQRAKIKALGIEDLFDEVIITDELGGINMRKPSPVAFEDMQKRLSQKEKRSIPFKEMCYVGDNIHKDFIAPAQLGMKAFFFNNPDSLYYSC